MFVSLKVKEEATTASNTNVSDAARTTEATPSPAQSGTRTNSPGCSSVPHPWHHQVEGVIPLPVNSKPFFPACINAAQYPKMTVTASFVADGH